MAVYGNVENIDAIVLANVEAGARHIDGFSPIVETEQTATGEHITITDKEAVHEFDIRNGSAMAARVEDETAYFTSDGAQYQPVTITDEGEYFESDTVEGALDELYEASADIKNDVEDLQDALETEQTAIRTVALGGTGADNAEGAIENLGIVDYVVETDFSNNWEYQKWASGRMTATRIVEWTNVAFTQSYMADGVPIGATVTMSQIALPNGLISAPNIIPACNHFVGYLIAVIDGISKAYATPRLIRLFSTSAIDEASFVLKLEGKWK